MLCYMKCPFCVSKKGISIYALVTQQKDEQANYHCKREYHQGHISFPGAMPPDFLDVLIN